MKGILELLRRKSSPRQGEEHADSVLFTTAFAGQGVDASMLVPWEARAVEVGAKRLTPAEQAVLTQLCAGRGAQEIACEQGIRVSTVRTHIKNVRQKTGRGSVREIVRELSRMPQIVSSLRLAG